MCGIYKHKTMTFETCVDQGITRLPYCYNDQYTSGTIAEVLDETEGRDVATFPTHQLLLERSAYLSVHWILSIV